MPHSDLPDLNLTTAVLECVGCGATTLSQRRVEVFDREEDDDEGLHVTVTPGTAAVTRTLDGNPSLRRHGLFVDFVCEQCPAVTRLSIAQHKGETILSKEPGR